MDINLYEECSRVASQIPEGRVSTYGAIARALGDIKARRAVGVIMNTYDQRTPMPCHRVVYHDGSLGGFAYGSEAKIKRLAKENVRVKKGDVVGFDGLFFDDFVYEGTPPLVRAREEQLRLARKVRLEDPDELPDIVLGLDVAYRKRKAWAAGVLYSVPEARVIDVLRTEAEIIFPYVPTYLSYTELPVLKNIVEGVREPVILMHDGNGTLHPHGIGLASHSGVIFDKPSIGVAKTLLCGDARLPEREGEATPVTLDRKIIGHALKTSAKAKPVFVSPGHGLSHDTALKLVKAVSRLKLPEPIRQAHLEATALRRSVG